MSTLGRSLQHTVGPRNLFELNYELDQIFIINSPEQDLNLGPFVKIPT